MLVGELLLAHLLGPLLRFDPALVAVDDQSKDALDLYVELVEKLHGVLAVAW